MLSAALACLPGQPVCPGAKGPSWHTPRPTLPFLSTHLGTEKGSSRRVASAHGGTFESLASWLWPVQAGSVQRLACLLQKKLVTLVLVWPLSLEILHGVC